MKRLLLVNPPYNHSIEGNLPRYVDDARGNIPPLGLLYTAAAVRARAGWDVMVCDMSAGQSLPDLHVDVVGITATSFTLLDALEVAGKVKERYGVPVVLGGIHASIFPQATAALPNIDCAYVGESEITFPDALDAIASGHASIVEGESPDVGMLPMPAFDLLELDRYYSVIGGSRKLVSMFTSRGCPYKCIFCHRLTMGRRFRARTPEQVLEELQYVAALGVREVLFYDDTFSVDMDRAKAICDSIIAAKRLGVVEDLKFDIRTRVSNVDEELLDKLKAAGCHRIHYGVEASSDRMLNVLQKGITIAEVCRAFRITRAVGIETLAYFMLGSPTETVEDILRTIQVAKGLKPDYCHFAVLTPYPATPLYSQGLADGLFPDYWARFAEKPVSGWEPPYWPELPRQELLCLLDRAYREFYMRPRYIWEELQKTRSLRQLVKKGKAALGMVATRG